MTESSNQWNVKYERLVEFKRENGHCMVPSRYKQDKSLGPWVRTQRRIHNNNNNNNNNMRMLPMLPGRKDLLDELGFVWRVDRSVLGYKANESRESIWKMRYENLAEFKRKNGHCMVPTKLYEQDRSLGMWVGKQRETYAKNEMRPDRKELLEKLEFAWKAHDMQGRSSTTDNSDSEAFTSSVGRPQDALEETEPAQGHVSNRFERPLLNRKRPPSACLAESGKVVARTNERGNAPVSCSSVKEVVEEEAHPVEFRTVGHV